MYLPQNSTICYELSRITTSKLRAFYELFTDCYEYIKEYNYSSKLYVLVTTGLRIVTNSYELVTSIDESLRFFAQKYINPANLNVSSFDNKS